MKMIKRLLLAIFVLLLMGAAFFVVVSKKFTDRYALVAPAGVMIPKGTGLNRTAALLEQNGVVDDARWFMLYARLYGLAGRLKAGEYAFAGEVSLETIAKTLVDGEVIVRSLTIPEGKALAEIKQIVLENPYLEGEITVTLKEGEILPETYHFTRGESRDSILKKARQAIVEKETGVVSERAKVASVFVNRLNLGMRLQTDPTVIYAVTGGLMNLGRPLYRKDLAYDSPYNTYIYAGLPPSPICSPGREALKAAAHPAKTKYLYFVADGITGGHNANVALYRKQLKK